MPALLKSLELNGYKTFASKTSFEFAEAVTAIVGPNGSGKSNVADAIRWVLGEQSYSLLRGRKTEDMIFSGSEQRSRAGMASASVLFDNSAGWLPIDFSEVSISRRAYRDGQNEYLINGQRVRLRDVSELLSKSGLAERTYTIIGQGLVDAALALRADERRRLFEEAAGIGLYRSRREEAVRRLENTHRNLERVRDILAELRPRLRSLERQARRSQQYSQVKDDLRVLLREWYGYHWHQSQKELVTVQTNARQHETTLNQARQQQDELNEKLGIFQRQIHELRSQLNQQHGQLAKFHLERENVSRQLAVLDERRRSLSLQNQELERAGNRLEEEIKFEETRVVDAKNLLIERENEYAEARAQNDEVRQSLQDQKQKQDAIEAQLQEARSTLAEFSAKSYELTARRDELSTRKDRLDELIQTAEDQIQIAEASTRKAEDHFLACKKKYEAAISNHQAVSDEVASLNKKIATVEYEKGKTAAALSERQAEVARFTAQLEVLSQAEKALIGYASGARLLLQAAQQGSLSGVQGAFGDHLEVNQEYELAIAAALGDYVDAILIEAQEDADNALQRLQNGQAKAALLPLSALRPPPPLKVPSDRDCLGLASVLVRVRSDLQPAVDLLLGRVLIVQDRRSARRILANQPAGTRAVTLQGEVFLSEGPIFVGLEDKKGVLGRPRQRREIQTTLAATSNEVAEQESQLQKVDDQLKEMRVEVDRLESVKRSAADAEAKNQVVYQQAEIGFEKEQRDLNWQKEQKQRMSDERENSEQELQAIHSTIADVDLEVVTARNDVRDQEELLAEIPIDDFKTRATYWELQVEVAGRVVTDANARLAERDQILERSKQRLADSRSREGSLADERGALKLEQSRLRQGERGTAEAIEELGRQIQPSERELETVETQQEKLRTEEIISRQALNLAERYYTQSQIALARRQEALETLRHRIEDDFGLVAFDYEDEITGPTPLPLEGMVEQLPVITELPSEAEVALQRKRAQLRRMGPVNPEAQLEYEEVRERFEFLTEQVADLEKAETDIEEVITELDTLMKREFRKTFDAVAVEFREMFTRLFGGGAGRLILTDPDDLTQTGIDIDARLPGRRTQGLSLLSGGERSLTATALVFSLLKVSPTPFCVLDEVDAMLDEANIGRFREMLAELSKDTQFVLITHNRGTVQVADIIYGVTMGHDSASQVLSLKLDQVADVVPG